jgi:hypothetical protein
MKFDPLSSISLNILEKQKGILDSDVTISKNMDIIHTKEWQRYFDHEMWLSLRKFLELTRDKKLVEFLLNNIKNIVTPNSTSSTENMIRLYELVFELGYFYKLNFAHKTNHLFDILDDNNDEDKNFTIRLMKKHRLISFDYDFGSANSVNENKNDVDLDVIVMKFLVGKIKKSLNFAGIPGNYFYDLLQTLASKFDQDWVEDFLFELEKILEDKVKEYQHHSDKLQHLRNIVKILKNIDISVTESVFTNLEENTLATLVEIFNRKENMRFDYNDPKYIYFNDEDINDFPISSNDDEYNEKIVSLIMVKTIKDTKNEGVSRLLKNILDGFIYK